MTLLVSTSLISRRREPSVEFLPLSQKWYYPRVWRILLLMRNPAVMKTVGLTIITIELFLCHVLAFWGDFLPFPLVLQNSLVVICGYCCDIYNDILIVISQITLWQWWSCDGYPSLVYFSSLICSSPKKNWVSHPRVVSFCVTNFESCHTSDLVWVTIQHLWETRSTTLYWFYSLKCIK